MSKTEQKQVTEGGNATLSVKVTQAVYDLLNILAEGLQHGTNANDLLKMFVQAFIESAKHSGPISTDMQQLLDMLKADAGWCQAFNFADPTKQAKVAQVILILHQSGRKGYGAVQINQPFVANKKPYMTYCVDDILERVVEVTMKGLYMRLRDVSLEMGSGSVRETLLKLIEDYHKHSMRLQFEEEGPQMGNYTDFGRAIEYGQRTKRKKHRTPDGEANRQQRIQFTDEDREQAEKEAERDLMDELSRGHVDDD